MEKVIHYCWFGNHPIPKSVRKCINSWKKYCPNYQIICWTEKNYSIAEKPQFVQDAYANKKWAFVSDYARLDIVFHYGGIYLDTDVELIKPIEELLIEGRGFFGFENNEVVASGLGFAAEAGEEILQEMMEEYSHIEFSVDDLLPYRCPIINTKILLQHGLKLNNQFQILEKRITIFSTEYLCPRNYYTGEMHMTEKTVSIHHYDASWQTWGERARNWCIRLVKRLLPSDIVEKLRLFYRERKQ